jgi:hypothetical protein
VDGPTVAAHLVLLQIGRTRVALSQGAVRSLESAADVDPHEARLPALGSIAAIGADLPVFALDEELAPLDTLPRNRRICAILQADHGIFGLLCDEAQVLPREGRSVHSLPQAMRRANSPIQGVITLEDDVALLATAGGLAKATGAATWFANKHSPEAR